MPNKERGLEHTKTILQQTGKENYENWFCIGKERSRFN